MENNDSLFSFDIMERGHALRDAVTDGDYIQVKRAVETGTCQINETDGNGRTVLHLAACRGHTEMIELFIANGGDVKIADRNGNTPLHWCGHVNSVELLIENGADVFALNKQGFTPLKLAERRGVPKDVLTLFQHLEEEVKKSNSSSSSNQHQRVWSRNSQANPLTSSILYEFYNDIGAKNMCLLVLGLLGFSLYMAYILTGLHLGFEERVPLDSQTYKIRL